MTPTIDELVLVAKKILGRSDYRVSDEVQNPDSEREVQFPVVMGQDGNGKAVIHWFPFNPCDSDADMAGLLRKLGEGRSLSITRRISSDQWALIVGGPVLCRPRTPRCRLAGGSGGGEGENESD